MRQLILKQNFSYNALGQRVGVSYTYTPPTSSSGSAVAIGTLLGYSRSYDYDQSGRLIAENKTNEYYGEPGDSEKIVFLYDEAGMVGFVYTKSGTSNTYYYDRNIRGDVIGIYDTDGNLVVKYNYDAWGNCTVASGTTNYVIANANPIRYRGYYYDVDTGLYYLNSRYYTPEWRRFISPDDTSYLDPETPNGLNLYCYCNNDPVNYADPSGHSVTAILLGGFAFGAFVGAGVSVATQWVEDKEINPWVVLNDAIFGGISGMLAVSGISSFWLAPLNSTLGSLQMIINAGIKGENINPTEIITTAIMNYAFTFIPMPELNARKMSEIITLSKAKRLTSVKYKSYYGNVIKNQYKIARTAAGAYAVSTPTFSFMTSMTSNYMEAYLYGTRKHIIP